MSDFREWSELPLFNNSLISWLIALAVTTAVFMALLLARRLVRQYHKRLRDTPRTELLEIPVEVLAHTTFPFFLIIAIYAGLQMLTVGPRTIALLDNAITIALFWQTGVWAVAAASGYIDRKRRASLTTDRAAVGSLSVIGFIVNLVIWALVLMLTLDNLGVDITALVAGLGIGGIAVALAVQNVLGDLFASLSITLDRPFVVGDFLILDDFMGSVEYIGIKSTRLRSLSGEQIIMANSDLLGSRLRNYGRMQERRVVFATRIPFETPVDLVEKVPGLIREIVTSQKNTRFDRAHFQQHGLASLDFETVYYVLSADYNQYMDIQQAINIELHRRFGKLGIRFAYPAQKLFLDAGQASPDREPDKRAA